MATFTLPSAVPHDVKEALSSYSSYLQQLLFARGITTQEAAQRFLNPSYDEHLHDPYLLHDMDTAVSRIIEAITQKERVVIYSDYDCDGIPGAVVLHDFFTAIGFDNFTNYIPHRHYEGFGFNAQALSKLHQEGAQLVITIDCGTSDIEAVAHANSLGVDVIITDHH